MLEQGPRPLIRSSFDLCDSDWMRWIAVQVFDDVH